MKLLFYIGLFLLAAFEILKVYFIMPFPGSQQAETIDIAYFLHDNRWYLRLLFGLMILGGAARALSVRRKWIPGVFVLIAAWVVYHFNMKMMADRIFLEPEMLTFEGRARNVLGDSTVVLAVENEGEAKAYPLRYIVYHHQVRDTVGGKPVMVTYCSVCRTGRVFEPVVDGKPENFRLVGMDHFNAMFEDATTKSWWRQVNGEAVAGPLLGQRLPEFPSTQLTLGMFFNMYPFGEVMQADPSSTDYYDTLARFETGKSRSELTGTDSVSWKDKSWVVGIEIGKNARAYDWNQLKSERIIHDNLAGVPVVLALSEDDQSFSAFKRNADDERFTLRNDSLIGPNSRYDFSGRGTTGQLERIQAYQEFWHSWKTFRPHTDQYGPQQQ
jgi:hypothetical protein